MNKIKYIKILKLIPLCIIFLYFLYVRIPLFTGTSNDSQTYNFAIEKFLNGENVYERTIKTFANPKRYVGDLGYSYLSGYLFLYSFINFLSINLQIDENILIKIPNFIADIAVGILIYKILVKKSYFAGLFGFFLWFINPYFLLRESYTYNDIIPVSLALIAFFYVKKDSVISGSTFALSVVFKTFPVVFFPLLLIKSENKKNFIISASIIGFAASLPFLTSTQYFLDYINGSLLVHSQRGIQGRPFLFYLSYLYDIELIQIIPTRVYSAIAVLGGFFITLIAYYFLKIRNSYLIAMLVSLNFYIFTPVLNRTYMLWFFPFILLGASYFLKRNKYIFYIISIFYYLIYYFYLKDWGYGFHESPLL